MPYNNTNFQFWLKTSCWITLKHFFTPGVCFTLTTEASESLFAKLWMPVSADSVDWIRDASMASCIHQIKRKCILFFTPTPFPLVKWMKLTPQLYCLRPRKVNGIARTETDKCPCDALQGKPATKQLARRVGFSKEPGCDMHWTTLRGTAPNGDTRDLC